MRNNGWLTDVGIGACYLAFAAVIVASNRQNLAYLIGDVQQWWRKNHPTGKAWREIGEAVERASNADTPRDANP